MKKNTNIYHRGIVEDLQNTISEFLTKGSYKDLIEAVQLHLCDDMMRLDFGGESLEVFEDLDNALGKCEDVISQHPVLQEPAVINDAPDTADNN